MAEILIIDDHDSIREGLELLLRRRGHRTRCAESGQHGLDLLEEEGADLVITDLKMSQMDGMEVLAQVKTSTPDTEVMVMTAHGTIERVVEAMKLGAADFITKPFSSEEFSVIGPSDSAFVDRRDVADRAERQRLRRENVALRVENT